MDKWVWSRQLFPGLRYVRILLFVLVTVLLATYLDLCTDFFSQIEQQVYSGCLTVDQVRHSDEAMREASQIRIVEIDDSTYLQNGSTGSLNTLPRTCYASLIDRLTSYDAKVIGLDLLLDSPAPGDAELAMSIKRSRRVILACGDEGTPARTVHPLALFERSGCYDGHTRVPFSASGAVIDEIYPVVLDKNRMLPALSVEAVRVYRGVQDRQIASGFHGWLVDGVPSVTEPDGGFRIRYIGSALSCFPRVLLQDIVRPTSPTMESFYRHYFNGKIVIVGDTTRDHGDTKMTPLGLMPGVLVHANAIATILGHNYIVDVTPLTQVLVSVLLALIAGFLVSTCRFVTGSCLLLLQLASFWLIVEYLFTEQSTYLHLIAPSAAVIGTAICVLLDRGLSEEREKTQMRSLLQRYVSPKIADHLILHPELIGSAGKRVTGLSCFQMSAGSLHFPNDFRRKSSSFG